MKDKKILSGVLVVVLLFTIFSNGINANDNRLLTMKAEINDTAPKGAFLISVPKKSVILEKYINAHSLTDKELVELLKAVGFEGQGLVIAFGVAKKESNGRPFAFNGNKRTGDSSFGVFQINMIGNLGPDRRDRYDLTYNSELFSPVKNAQIVYKMTKGGKDWSSWNGLTPSTKMWMKKFPK